MNAKTAFPMGVVCLFPELLGPFLRTSVIHRAQVDGRVKVHLESLREHGLGKHRSVDDAPYGGGAGMVLRVDCVVDAIEEAERHMDGPARACRVLLTPQGRRFDQSLAKELVGRDGLLLVCGRYEGFDERVRHFVDEQISIGDFVLAGGEVAAMALMETCIRLIPGVLGNPDSPTDESFSDHRGGWLEYPQYTRPLCYRELSVPEILRSGDHQRIENWRKERSRERTLAQRPDLAEPTGRHGLP